MKEIKQVSLNSMVFYVEDDGYIVLKQYISRLERYYADKEGGKEIVEDIQIRFAELLLEKRTFLEQAITLSNIEAVIAVLGYPDSFEPEESGESKQQEPPPHKKRKQLYRDLENAKIAGVCSGLSYYFDIDAWVFRLAFICLSIFSVGFWLLVYVVLWFILPKAKTTQQRYEMKGEALHIEDIEQRVKSGINEAETKIRNFANKNADTIRDTTQEISSSAKNIFKIIGKMFGFCLIFAAICAIATILLTWFFPFPDFFKIEKEYSIFGIREIFTLFGLNGTASFLCLMCVLLPLFMILLFGIVFFTAQYRKIIGFTLLGSFILWIVLTIFFAIGITTFVGDMRAKETFVEEIQLPFTAQNIIIKPQSDMISRKTGIRFFGNQLFIQSENNQTQIYGIPRLNHHILYTNDSIVSIRILKNFSDELCDFQDNITVEDSIIYIPALFHLKRNYWSGETINMQISVPKGKQISIEKPFSRRKTVGINLTVME